jgi:hypothetical protein
VSFESGVFFRQGGVKLCGLILFRELKSAPASEDLALLANEIANGRLYRVEAPWTEIDTIRWCLMALNSLARPCCTSSSRRRLTAPQ